MQPLTTGYVNRRISSEHRATILSMQGMVGSLTLAALAPAAGFITDEWGLATAFGAGAAATAAAVMIFGGPLLGKKEPPAAPPTVVEPLQG
jgi:MFS family permease